jgi:hypothetical protein
LEVLFTQDIVSISTLLILAAKWYHDHLTIKEIKEDNSNLKKSFSVIEKENLKIIEALERTYASKEYLFKNFLSGKDIDEKLKHLDSMSESEFSHINNSIDKLNKLIEKKS